MRKKIDEAIGNFDEQAARVKQAITDHKKYYVPQKRQKKFVKPLLALAAAITLFIAGYFAATQLSTQTASDEAISHENKANSNEQVSHGMSFPSDKILEILKYEYFYRNSLLEEELAEISAYDEAAQIFSVLYHMEKYNYTFPKEREAHYRGRAQAAFNLQMEDENFKEYFEFIRKEYGITEEDYVNEYLFINEVSQFMQKELHKNYVGYVDNRYPEEDVIEEYKKVAGLETDWLEKEYLEKMEKLQERVDPTIENPIAAYPLDYYPPFQFARDEEGKVIIVSSPKASEIEINYKLFPSNYYRINDVWDILYTHVYENDHLKFYEDGWLVLSRLNAEQMKEKLEKFEGTEKQEAIVQDLLAYIEILENTIGFKVTRPITRQH